MSAETNAAMVRRLVKEAQEGGNLDVVDELLAEDFVDHSPLPGLPPTRDGVRMLFAGMQAAFPDLRVMIHEQIADEEKVVTRKTFSGTHRGSFMGVPATGNPVSFDAIDILTVRDGKLSEHRVVVDQLTLMQQIGAL
jgi:steroid delta-isomerase-like uncharacterized protein